MSNKYLEVTNLKKSFGGIKAVDVESLNLNRDELTSIIGPNGAGKTTFFDLISGFQDSDEVLFCTKRCHIKYKQKSALRNC